MNGRKRRVYQLTAKGERAFETARLAWEEVVPILASIVGESKCLGGIAA